MFPLTVPFWYRFFDPQPYGYQFGWTFTTYWWWHFGNLYEIRGWGWFKRFIGETHPGFERFGGSTLKIGMKSGDGAGLNKRFIGETHPGFERFGGSTLKIGMKSGDGAGLNKRFIGETHPGFERFGGSTLEISMK